MTIVLTAAEREQLQNGPALPIKRDHGHAPKAAAETVTMRGTPVRQVVGRGVRQPDIAINHDPSYVAPLGEWNLDRKPFLSPNHAMCVFAALLALNSVGAMLDTEIPIEGGEPVKITQDPADGAIFLSTASSTWVEQYGSAESFATAHGIGKNATGAWEHTAEQKRYLALCDAAPQMLEALKAMDEAMCNAGNPHLSKEQRDQGRQAIILTRAVIAAVEAG